MKRCLSLTLLIILIAAFSRADNLQNVRIGGDLRYRQESHDADNKPNRYRHNFRARLNATGKVNDYMKLKVQVCTGTDDPLSTNQTLDNGFSSKEIWLDWAYAEANFDIQHGLTFYAGKMPSPFFDPSKVELIWDVKIRPEGLAGHLDFASSDNSVLWRWSLGWFLLEERPEDLNSYLLAGQTVISSADTTAPLSWKAAVGLMEYHNMKGFPPLYDPSSPLGNSVDLSGNYLYDYTVWTSAGLAVFRQPPVPVSLFYEIAYNSSADSNNFGWTLGTQLGEIAGVNSWSLYYKLRKLETDAVVNLYTDVSFRGNGNDNLCHELIGTYKPLDRFLVMVSGHFWKILEEGELHDQKRGRFDLIFEF